VLQRMRNKLQQLQSSSSDSSNSSSVTASNAPQWHVLLRRLLLLLVQQTAACCTNCSGCGWRRENMQLRASNRGSSYSSRRVCCHCRHRLHGRSRRDM
jgi:hypothetical protein